MNGSEIVAKIIVKVYLVSGREINHTYEVPTNDNDMNNLITELTEKELGLIRGEKVYIHYFNPNITYNADNIEGIELSSIGVQTLASAIEKAQSSIGFVKN